MRTSVVIPTWKRVKKLNAALESLAQQISPPEKVIVVHRPDDTETVTVLAHWKQRLPLVTLEVHRPGVINAENCALRFLIEQKFTGIITFMDDDAIALPDWMKAIQDFFIHHPEAAAVGGPDMILSEPESYHRHFAEKVGIITFSGRVIGNHHRRSEGLREVDVLKGVNFSFRSDYLTQLDENLQGEDPARGNGVFWELELCLWIKKNGGRIYFDPSLLIHHDSHHGHFIQRAVMESTAHNLGYVLGSYLSPLRKFVFIVRSVLIGSSHVRGIIKSLIEALRDRSLTPLLDGFYSLQGFFRGLRLSRHRHSKVR